MKRRLIDYKTFEQMSNSVSNAQHELKEAEQIISNILDLEGLQVRSFDADKVIFETVEGEFVHADYGFSNGYLTLENIENIVINEETEKVQSREMIAEILDLIVTNRSDEASVIFGKLIQLPHMRRNLSEGTIIRRREVRKRKDGKLVGTGVYRKAVEHTYGRKENPSFTTRRAKARKMSMRKRSSSNKKMRAIRRNRIKIAGRKQMAEWFNICEGVMSFIDGRSFEPVLKNTKFTYDDRDNVVSLKIPSRNMRNEAKMLSLNVKTLSTDLIVKRTNAKNLKEDHGFSVELNNLRHQNAMSDNAALGESLDKIVTNWPNVIYLTEKELSVMIKESLEAQRASNFSDEICDFMAEGILLTAFESYDYAVDKIVNLSGAKLDESAEDKYDAFKSLVNDFYPYLDETSKLEMQAFVDLYEVLREVYEAIKGEDSELANEAVVHLRGLYPIVKQDVVPDITVAEAAAEWLYDLIETNLEAEEWEVSDDAFLTVNGDHPQMAKNAKKGYTPASDFEGDWGGTAPVSDGKSYKNGLEDEMRNDSWANIGGSDTWPTLNNPYQLKPFSDYKIKGETDIESDDADGNWQSGDTFPGLTNPYIPAAVKPNPVK